MLHPAFTQIRFRGEFRDYQSRVLENADRYLADGRIHIVAAPGSGKTVLGLELIRRLGEPCLIFSPTTAIREQWGERFRTLFLPNGEEAETLFSTDLHHIKPITSVTYQALYSAMEQVDEAEDGETSAADVDILREIRERGIGTICLDEAHHLKNEWQRALEKLLSLCGEDIKRIALTATPPYDAEGGEWSRYLSLCGEVDEEIFVPELVARDTLCPHQDYIYFNYPTRTELEALDTYREHARAATAAVGALPWMPTLCEAINRERDLDRLFSAAKEYSALLVYFTHLGLPVERRVIRALLGKRGLPAFDLSFAEAAIRFLATGDLTSDDQKAAVIALCKEHGIYHQKKIELVQNERLRRRLVASAASWTASPASPRAKRAPLGQVCASLC